MVRNESAPLFGKELRGRTEVTLKGKNKKGSAGKRIRVTKSSNGKVKTKCSVLEEAEDKLSSVRARKGIGTKF